jgi:hypothetical protein
MKVLNLACGQGHTFEGWFASEEDFVAQCRQAQLQCPLCGDATVTKKPSAPHVMRSGKQAVSQVQDASALWLSVARQIMAQTTDVGANFAEEARKIHYGETPERGIRGTASLEETRSLLEEGVSVVPFPVPQVLKEPLQ